MRQIDKEITKVKESATTARSVMKSAFEDNMSKDKADCVARLDRQSARHEQQMEALRNTLVTLQVDGITAKGFKEAIQELKTELEGNFMSTTKVLILENNKELTRDLVTQMSKIMEDKLNGMQRKSSN